MISDHRNAGTRYSYPSESSCRKPMIDEKRRSLHELETSINCCLHKVSTATMWLRQVWSRKLIGYLLQYVLSALKGNLFFFIHTVEGCQLLAWFFTTKLPDMVKTDYHFSYYFTSCFCYYLEYYSTHYFTISQLLTVKWSLFCSRIRTRPDMSHRSLLAALQMWIRVSATNTLFAIQLFYLW